jgi:predicted nucleic acid-binding protein
VIAYIDSSVFLRFVLRQPMVLPELQTITIAVTSSLLRVECCRTLDRFVHNGALAEIDYTIKLAEVDAFIDRALVFKVDEALLLDASRRLPLRLATLDAIHLATAERFRDEFDEPFVFATHDRELADAAHAAGFTVIGSPKMPA